MPTTRKKNVNTVYKDEDDSDEGGDFSDSGSDAELPQPSSSDEDVSDNNSETEFKREPRKKQTAKVTKKRKTNFTKSFLNKINKQNNTELDDEHEEEAPFSIKDLTDADKLLPAILNLSESDSSDDDEPKVSHKKHVSVLPCSSKTCDSISDSEVNAEYKDVWSHNKPDNSEEIAHKTYLELEKHKNKIEETKKSIQNYVMKTDNVKEADIKDLLALGEEESTNKSNDNVRVENDDSEAEMEDWEEVKESKGIPQQGLQLVVNIPDSLCRKRKKVDIDMILKRKANRNTKESQLYKHKVHVLCWLGHGNYVSRILNDQDIMTNVLSLLPSKQCYPGSQVDIKYIEQITTWFKDKITLKQDKHENKFKPKAPPLKAILLEQMKKKVFSTKKYIVFAFVSMLRSLGLQCRVMINFVTLPIRPPASELLSLSTKSKDDIKKTEPVVKAIQKRNTGKKTDVNIKIPQLDGNYDLDNSDSDIENIIQLDGNDDPMTSRTKKSRNIKSKGTNHQDNEVFLSEDNPSPPKKPRRQTRSQIATAKSKDMSDVENTVVPKTRKSNKKIESQDKTNITSNAKTTRKSLSLSRQVKKNIPSICDSKKDLQIEIIENDSQKKVNKTNVLAKSTSRCQKSKENNNPKIIITKVENNSVCSEYFENIEEKDLSNRKRSLTSEPKSETGKTQTKARTRSAQGKNTSEYFENTKKSKVNLKSPVKKMKLEDNEDDNIRVSHKDLIKAKQKPKNDVSKDLINIMKGRIKEAKAASKLGVVKAKIKKESDEDSDYLPMESPKRQKSGSDDDFKIKKNTPKPMASSSKKKDRRVLSTDDELPINKVDVWAEVFVEELEEWISVDVIEGKVHCTTDIYRRATHPVTYVVGWDNNNNIKDLTKKYVPHWNTVTRKQRVPPMWWDSAVKPWLTPKTARDKEEDERLERMQLEAPLPKSIAEYKNHPLYALSRHLLKFEAIYPPDAATLGFVRGEAVYARSCVFVCRSRETWLKEAKVVCVGEKPYKVVKARPKWDKLSNKLITDKPLEVFGPWQVQDYEPPTAEHGIVPRNAYGNVELFKQCMLPKGTVHIKLPGLNRIAKKLNIDCAPAMTGFEFNGGWSHPVYDGFVVCEEFGDLIKEAWVNDQEDLERKEMEKLHARVYGNWKRLIKGLLIKQRLKAKYGFEDPSTSKESSKSKGPRLVVKKK